MNIYLKKISSNLRDDIIKDERNNKENKVIYNERLSYPKEIKK